MACDVAQEDDVARAVEVAKEATGGLQHCVASAGTGTVGPVVALPASEWDRVMDINLRGAFFTLKHAAAAMVASGGGAFVGLSSIAGPLTHPFMSAYCVSKAGLEALVRNAADELGRCQRAGERGAAQPRAHRAGRPARAGPGRPRRLPRQHADQPHRHRGRRRPPDPVPVRPRVVLDHRRVHQHRRRPHASGGARTSRPGPGRSTATRPSTGRPEPL